jgi:hypothetical protein
MMDVICFSQAKNDNIVDVTFGKGKTIQNLIHNSLKFCNRSILKPNCKNCHNHSHKDEYPKMLFWLCHLPLMVIDGNMNISPKC